jgi:hypothetical protein
VIFRRGSIYGVELDFSKRKNTSVVMYNKKYISSEEKYISSDVKNTSVVTDSLNPLKRTNQDRGVGMKKLSYKEAEKLEGKKWLKQVMWQRGNFSIKFIDEIFEIYSFTQCYDTYIAYQGAHNVREKQAWFLAKLRRGPEPEE